MQFQNVCVESVAATFPREILTSDELEAKLAPLYQRLKLPPGRLELMTGITERRFWPVGTLPGDVSIVSGQRAMQVAEIKPAEIGCLIHASVCRDHLEPATASRVHHELGLPPNCVIYDVSNACLGVLNGILQVASMIELGQIRAGLVVASEGGRQLVENTIQFLNHNDNLTRKSIKNSVASLTIGSASCGVLLRHREDSQSQTQLIAGAVRAHTAYHTLCHSGADEAVADGMKPLMLTDSENLMKHGVETGQATFADLLSEADWKPETITRSIGHQVGVAHRSLLLESLGLNPDHDHITYPWLGNTGSAALPSTLADAMQKEFVKEGDHVCLMGIGSGINCVMLAAKWGKSPVSCGEFPN